jgi:hypothetical protein
MSISIKALLTTAFFGLPGWVVAEELPATCCPSNCKTVKGPVTLGATFVTADFSNSGAGKRTAPFARDVHFGKSPDASYHICIQYTEFGDEEIKCILTPDMM